MYYYPVSAVLIESLILAVVEKEDSYGYEISQTIKLVASIKESTLYPILRKLETNGYVRTYTKELFDYRKRLRSFAPAKTRMERVSRYD